MAGGSDECRPLVGARLPDRIECRLLRLRQLENSVNWPWLGQSRFQNLEAGRSLTYAITEPLLIVFDYTATARL